MKSKAGQYAVDSTHPCGPQRMHALLHALLSCAALPLSQSASHSFSQSQRSSSMQAGPVAIPGALSPEGNGAGSTSQPLVTSCPCHVCLLHHCTAPSWHVVSERSSTCCLLVRCLHCHSARWVTDEVMMIIYVLLYSLSSVSIRNRYGLYYSSGDSILPLLKKRM